MTADEKWWDGDEFYVNNEPRTIPEMLDAAARVPDKGEAFGKVLNGLFNLAAKAKDEADDE